MTPIQRLLFALEDKKYKEFHAKLLPTVDPDSIIGVRVPLLRNLARRLAKGDLAESEDVAGFMRSLPHKYYDENMLHSFLLQQIGVYATCLEEVERFLPYIDNWAVCDSLNPKVFNSHRDELLVSVKRWVSSPEVYTCRVGVCMLMNHYLDEHFSPDLLQLPLTVKPDDYYVRMVVAWYYATALAKQWDATIPFVEKRLMATWTHNKTLQKAIESYRITDNQKDYLRTLRIRRTK